MHGSPKALGGWSAGGKVTGTLGGRPEVGTEDVLQAFPEGCDGGSEATVQPKGPSDSYTTILDKGCKGDPGTHPR